MTVRRSADLWGGAACDASVPRYADILDAHGEAAAASGRTCVVGAVIVDPRHRVFMLRRAPHVRLFPGWWDIVGGHVEAGESATAALAREVAEETGWRLVAVGPLVRLFEWDGSEGVPRREVDVLAIVEGDLENPSVEASAFSEHGWFDAAKLERLATAQPAGSAAMIELALDALHRSLP